MAADTTSNTIYEVRDNHTARDLCGVEHENIKYIEDTLHVRIRAHGNELEVRGESSAVAEAERIFQTLEDMITVSKKTVTPADVKGLMNTKAQSGNLGKIATRKNTLVARTPKQDEYMQAMKKSELVFGVGPAGTGKTYLAVAHAAALLEKGDVERIILTRPAVEAGERLGFLPGDLKEKVDPYLRPLYDALYDMVKPEDVERMLASGIIEVAPLAFMRGRTLTNAAVILDEAQNTTTMQMKMFLTRLGENSRMIVTGDMSQIDLPRGEKSGLVEALKILDGVAGISISVFEDTDVVRHELVGRIVKAYNKADADAANTTAKPAAAGTAPKVPVPV